MMKKMRTMVYLAVACIMVLTLFTACSTKTVKAADVTSAEGTKLTKEFLIGLSQESLDHPFMITQRKQINEAAAKFQDVKVVATDGQGQVAKQVSGIEDMLAQNIDILLVQAAKAEGLKQELEKLKEKGVPFIFVGKPIKGTAAVTMVSMDNYVIGKQVGEFIVKTLKEKNGSEKGNVVIIEGIPGDQTSEDRIGGALDVIKAFPDIKIVAKQPADYRRPKALTVTQAILAANPKGIDFLYAANGEMALGAIQAVKDANRLGEFAIVGIDGQKEELDAIKAGEQTATWQYKPCGSEGLEIAMKILNGEKVEPVIIVPSDMITKENVDKYEPSF